jgi:hypothetical protein
MFKILQTEITANANRHELGHKPAPKKADRFEDGYAHQNPDKNVKARNITEVLVDSFDDQLEGVGDFVIT